MSEPSPHRTPAPLPAPAARLEDFCHAALALLRADDGAVVSLVAPALARSLADGSRGVIDRLRGELQGWEAAALPLRRLANSEVPGLGREAAALLGRLEEARSQAARVVEVLEALDDGPRPTAVSDVRASADGQALALFERAEACLRSRQLVEAEALYSESLRLDPTLRAAYLHRGRARAFQGRAEESIADLGEAIRADPHDAVAYWWRGDALALCDRLREAVEDYSAALRLRPDLFRARYNRASSLRQLGDTTRSLLEFEALIVLRPGDASLYLNRGLIHLGRGRLRRALADFRTTLRIKPDSQEARVRAREAKGLLRARRRESIVAEPSLPPLPSPSEAPLPKIGGIPSQSPRPELAVETPSPRPAPPSVPQPIPASRSVESTGGAADPTAPVRPPSPPAVSGGAPARGGGKAVVTENNLTLDCPSCRRSSVVRWDKLQRGKVLGCPHCDTRLTAREDGQLVEVVKDGAGRWVERSRKEGEEGRRRARRRWLVAGAGAVALAGCALFWGPRVLRARPTAEAELPRDLESRGAMFAKAWLAGDYARMRRLTDPAQDKLLFAWYKKNRPSTKTDGTGVAVEVLPGKPPMASLRVRFVAERPDAARPPVPLHLAWEERGGVWIFKPAPHVRPQRAGGA